MPKTIAILNAINRDIETHSALANESFAAMEMMNISPEDFKKANCQFCLNRGVVDYLQKFKEMAEAKEPLKTIENRMRFHVHQQSDKGDFSSRDDISAAQAAIVSTLEGYINQFFAI